MLERLNSVLERERRLLVSERSRGQGQGEGEVFQITAAEGFVFMATMNPGGDYGKKEVCAVARTYNYTFGCFCSSVPIYLSSGLVAIT